jgi:AbiU2
MQINEPPPRFVLSMKTKRTSVFRALRFKSPDEFDHVLEHLTHEAYRARMHWNAWVAMEESFDEYWQELNITPGFWELTRRAHQDIVILRLGRLYDTHASATSLGNFLATLQDNVASAHTLLPAKVAKLNVAKLEKNLKSVSEQNPAVKKLLTIRNEYIAHRGPQHVTSGSFEALPKLVKRDLSHLLTNAVRIMTTYRRSLGYPPIIWGNQEEREFKELLQIIRAGEATQRQR